MEYKYDYSDRAHDRTISPKIGWWKRSLITAGGGEPETLVAHGSRKEIADFEARGAVLLGSAILSSVTAAAVFHFAFGDGGFDLVLALAGLAIGALQGLIDLVAQYKGALHSKGLTELQNSGLKLPVPERAVSLSGLIRFGRVAQAATLGFLGGLVCLMGAVAPETQAYEDKMYMIDNRPGAEGAAKIVDSGIGRTRAEYAQETAEVDHISRAIQALRSSDVRRAIGASRKPNSSTSDTQLAALEKRLAEETAKRDAMKAELDREEAGRNAAIEKAISESPQHIPKRAGLSGRLEALGALLHDDPKLLLLAVAFQLISLALELGPMWCSFTYIPSAFAARVALAHFVEVSKLAMEGAQQLGVPKADERKARETGDVQDKQAAEGRTSDTPAKDANDNRSATSGMNGATPPRRGPGRPRKNPIVPPPAGGSSHA